MKKNIKNITSTRKWLLRGLEARAEIVSKEVIRFERIGYSQNAVLEIESEIHTLEKKWKEIDGEIKAVIQDIPDIKIREVMERRYRAYMSYSAIAEEMYYSESSIKQFIQKGEKFVQNCLNLS